MRGRRCPADNIYVTVIDPRRRPSRCSGLILSPEIKGGDRRMRYRNGPPDSANRYLHNSRNRIKTRQLFSLLPPSIPSWTSLEPISWRLSMNIVIDAYKAFLLPSFHPLPQYSPPITRWETSKTKKKTMKT